MTTPKLIQEILSILQPLVFILLLVVFIQNIGTNITNKFTIICINMNMFLSWQS